MYASHLTDKNMKEYADKALDLINSYGDEDLEFKMKAENLRDSIETGFNLRKLHKELIDIIEFLELNEQMEICRDCGHIPETGACNYCKQD